VGFFDLPVVYDVEGAEGPLAGLTAALLSCKKERLLVLAGDLPLLRAPMISSLLSLSPEASAVAPQIDGRLQPLCAVYASSLGPLALSLLQSGERAALRLFEAAGGVIARPDQLGPEEDVITALRGVNTQEELAALLRKDR
jgi:molybdopterin-guanine dinucleotide biosynthesis protein A